MKTSNDFFASGKMSSGARVPTNSRIGFSGSGTNLMLVLTAS